MLALVSLTGIIKTFRANVQGVQKLIDFDRELLDFATNQLRQLRTSVSHQGLAEQLKRTEDILRTVRKNDSLKGRFDIIHGQAVVLFVSYFASTMEDLFKFAVTETLRGGAPAALRDTELKLTFGDLEERGWEIKDSAADFLIETKDISFQDMQSISRAFKEHLTIQTPKGPIVDNIIMAQACRHVIVHAGSEVTARMLKQIRSTESRDLKKKVVLGQQLEFAVDELEIISTSMEAYISQIGTLVQGKLSAF